MLTQYIYFPASTKIASFLGHRNNLPWFGLCSIMCSYYRYSSDLERWWRDYKSPRHKDIYQVSTLDLNSTAEIAVFSESRTCILKQNIPGNTPL